MNEFLPQIAPRDPAAVAAAEAAKARIQSAYMMALHNPRNIDQARARILHNCKRPGFAARVEYSKPVGKNNIKGPSVRFAELAIREWGNIFTESQVIYEDDNIRRVRLTVTDLESNSSHSKEMNITKTVERKYSKDREVVSERENSFGEKVFIVKSTDEELHNKEAALISKALRNEGLRLIPTDIIDEAIDVARATLAARDKEDPDAAKKALLDAFMQIGIEPKDVEAFLGHSSNAIQPAELQELRGMYTSIKEGTAKWSDYVQPKEPVDNAKNGTQSKQDQLKADINAAKAKK